MSTYTLLSAGLLLHKQFSVLGVFLFPLTHNHNYWHNFWNSFDSIEVSYFWKVFKKFATSQLSLIVFSGNTHPIPFSPLSPILVPTAFLDKKENTISKMTGQGHMRGSSSPLTYFQFPSSSFLNHPSVYISVSLFSNQSSSEKEWEPKGFSSLQRKGTPKIKLFGRSCQ